MVDTRLRVLLWVFLFSAFFVQGFAANLPLTPQQVAERTIQMSLDAKELSLQTQQGRLAAVQTRERYSWGMLLESNYEDSQAEDIRGVANERDQTLFTRFRVEKKIPTGTKFSWGIERTSMQSELGSFSQALRPANQVQDKSEFSIEQSLLNNAFGKVDRMQNHAANIRYEVQKTDYYEQLESVVLSSMQLYWQTYAASQLLEEAIDSRERYKGLYKVTRRKKRLGYANPGEFAQVQAELELRDQDVKRRANEYLEKQERLLTTLRYPVDREIQFIVPATLPPAPSLKAVEVEKQRQIKNLQRQIQASEMDHLVAKSQTLPELNLVLKASSTGVDQDPTASFSELTSSTHPTYFAGLQFRMTFGSGTNGEKRKNTFRQKQILETQLQRVRENTINLDTHNSRRVKVFYAIADSALKQKRLRAKAVTELTKSYKLGKTDLGTLIRALNDLLRAGSNVIKTVGDYHVALNEWAAVRDELINIKKLEEKE